MDSLLIGRDVGVSENVTLPPGLTVDCPAGSTWVAVMVCAAVVLAWETALSGTRTFIEGMVIATIGGEPAPPSAVGTA